MKIKILIVISVLIPYLSNGQEFDILQKYRSINMEENEELMYRFPILIKSGYFQLFHTSLHNFIQPTNITPVPGSYLPDEYFNKNSHKLFINKDEYFKYGIYVLTVNSEYVFVKKDTIVGWLKAQIPVNLALKNQLRKLIINKNYKYVQVIPFNNKERLLIYYTWCDCFIYDIPSNSVIWQRGHNCNNPVINFKTDNLHCLDNSNVDEYIFDKNGKLLKDNEMIIFQDILKMADSLQKITPKLDPSIIMEQAIKNADTLTIDSLLQMGFDIESNKVVKPFFNTFLIMYETTVLSRAVIANNLITVKFLLKKGASVNKLDIKRKTPICYAQSPEIFAILLNNGASIGALYYDEINPYNSELGDEYVYPTNYFTNLEIYDIIIKTAPDSLFKDFDFYSKIIHDLVFKNDTIRIKNLIARGANLNKPRLRKSASYLYQPLYYSNSAEMMKLLINNGARITDLDAIGGSDAMSKAIFLKDTSLIEWLESKGLKLRIPNNPDFVNLRDTAMMKYLIVKGVSINSVDNWGNTALILVKYSHRVDIEFFLLRNGADKAIINKQGGSYYIGLSRKK